MCGGSSFHPRRFLAGVPRSTSSGSINLWIHRLRHTVSAVFGRGCDGRRGVCATPLYRYLCMPRSFYTSVVSACGVSAYRAVRRVSGAFCTQLLGIQKIPGSEEPGIAGAPEGIRTPNLLIRSQMLYPLSYRRMFLASDFFNPSRQQVLLYGCPRGCASRKSRNLPKFPSEGVENTPFCRMIPGFLCSQNFFKIFLSHPKTCPGTARNTRLDPAESLKNTSKNLFALEECDAQNVRNSVIEGCSDH